jgi:type I restriction enzyme M protein
MISSWPAPSPPSLNDIEDDDVPFAERLAALRTKLESEFERADKLATTVREKLAGIATNA